MSRLENVAQKLLSPLVGTEWPANEKTILQTLFLHSADLTLWLLKTAATLGEKMAMRVPQFVIEQLRLQRIPEWVYSDIAFSEQAGHRLVISNSWNVVKDGEVTVRKNEHSFRLTWQIRHLTLRVSHFPFTERHQLKPRYPVRVYPKFMVPPDYALDGVAKRSYAYQNVEQLERETTYVIRDRSRPPASSQLELIPPTRGKQDSLTPSLFAFIMTSNGRFHWMKSNSNRARGDHGGRDKEPLLAIDLAGANRVGKRRQLQGLLQPRLQTYSH